MIHIIFHRAFHIWIRGVRQLGMGRRLHFQDM